MHRDARGPVHVHRRIVNSGGKYCFGSTGIVGPIVSVYSGSEGEFTVMLQAFWESGDYILPVPDERCEGANAQIKYSVAIEPCSLTAGSFPPAPGDEPAEITCSASTAAWSVSHQGGGGIGRKCGCHANGPLVADTVIYVRGTSP